MLAVVCVSLLACQGPGASDDGRAPIPTGPSEVVVHGSRDRSAPNRPIVVVDAPPGATARIHRAIADLRSAGVWEALSAHLFAVTVSAVSGPDSSPEDGHLADAFFRPHVVKRPGGRYCGIRFYASAVKTDLARQRYYFDSGRLAEEPPSLRIFWAAILAHELTHCRDEHNGEAPALKVEQRVVERLELE